MAPRLVSRTVRQPDLPESTRRRMLALMQLCYDGVSVERFRRDLAEKQYVILLEDRGTREVVGFSTIRLERAEARGERAQVLFSGDTVLHPDYWGQKVLDGAFARFLFERKLRNPLRSLRWMLLSGGYKTYLIILRYFPLAFPRRDREPTARARTFRDELCQRWFGPQYDPSSGVLRLAEHYHVRSGIAPVDREAAQHPDIAFFAAKNPGHVAGDELVCMAEVRLRDLLRAFLHIAWRRSSRAVVQSGRMLLRWGRA